MTDVMVNLGGDDPFSEDYVQKGLMFHGGFYQDPACDNAFVWTVKDQNGGIWQRGVDYDKCTARNLAMERSRIWNEDFGNLDPVFLYQKLMEYRGPKGFYESEEYKQHYGLYVNMVGEN